MILLFITIVMMAGSVAATDTTSNDTTDIQTTDSLEETSTTASTLTKDTSTNTSKTITKTSTNSTKSSSSTADSTLTKTQSKTNIKVYNITTTNGSKVTFKAQLTTINGSKVNGGVAVFKINGNTIGKANVTKGGATLTYTIPTTWASRTYNITVAYGTNANYIGSRANGILKVISSTPVVKINTTSVKAGASATFITTITDQSGNVISGGKVAFKLNGKTIGTATVSKGVAKITYTIPSSWKGTYNMTVVYGGNSYYDSIRKSSVLTVINQASTKITINTTKATSGSSVSLIATVTDSSGKKVSQGKGVFKINGKTIGTVNVTKGVAKLTYTIPSSWSGKYNITFVYGENTDYKASRKTSTLTITKKTTSKFSVPSGYESYVKSTTNCKVTNSKIQSLAKSLISNTTTAYQAAVKIYNYVRDKISYTYYLNTRYGSVGTLTKKTGNCVDQTHLLIALMRASNIPARYCHATCTFSSGLVIGHVWAEVYVNGKWYKCDTTSSRNSFNVINNWYKSTKVYRYTSLSF